MKVGSYLDGCFEVGVELDCAETLRRISLR